MDEPSITCTRCHDTSSTRTIVTEPKDTASAAWLSIGGVRLDLPAYPRESRAASLRAIDDIRRGLDRLEASLRVITVAPQHRGHTEKEH